MRALLHSPTLWIAGVGLVLYARTLGFGFVHFDDDRVILEQLAFLGDPSNLPRAFAEDVFRSAQQTYYRPLLTLSLMIDAQLFGDHALGYHLTNVVLHIVASCCVWVALEHLRYGRGPAVAAALLFAAWPVHTQAVAWIMGRNDLLLACFVVPAFTTFLAYVEAGRRSALAAHVALFSAALFTKESALALPVVCVAYLVLSGEASMRRRQLARLTSLWLGCGMVWWLARSLAFQNPRPLRMDALWYSAAEAGPALVQQLGKLFLPVNLSVLPTVADTSLWPGIAAVAVVAALVTWTPTERRWMSAFAGIWIAAFLLPTVIHPNASGVPHYLEHRLYVPTLGALLLALESPLLARFDIDRTRHRLALGAVLAACAVGVGLHTRVFQDRMEFWESAARHSPSHPLAQRNLGAIHFLAGDLDRAEARYQQALALNPEEALVQNNLGLVYARRGDYTRAEAAYLREMESHPSFADPYVNLALLRIAQAQSGVPGAREQVIPLLREALVREPHNARATDLLARLDAPPS